jgi:hypothetical protein
MISIPRKSQAQQSHKWAMVSMDMVSSVALMDIHGFGTKKMHSSEGSMRVLLRLSLMLVGGALGLCRAHQDHSLQFSDVQ